MIDGLSIESNKTEVLLGMNVDLELKFDENVNYLCKKSGQKPYVLACIAHFVNMNKKENKGFY